MLKNDLMGFNFQDNKTVYALLSQASNVLSTGANTSPIYVNKDDPYNIVLKNMFQVQIPYDGIYSLNAQLTIGGAGNGARTAHIFIIREGVTTSITTTTGDAAGGIDVSLPLSRVVRLKKGDILQPVGFQNGGVDNNFTNTAASNYFSLVQIA